MRCKGLSCVLPANSRQRYADLSHVLRNIRPPDRAHNLTSISFASAAVGHYDAANSSLIQEWSGNTHHSIVLPLLIDPDPQRYTALI
jgi:hypothetical protein